MSSPAEETTEDTKSFFDTEMGIASDGLIMKEMNNSEHALATRS